MKHINERMAEAKSKYEANLKQLSTKLKKANKQLKEDWGEQMMDYYKIKRLEKEIHEISKLTYAVSKIGVQGMKRRAERIDYLEKQILLLLVLNCATLILLILKILS